MISNPLTAQRAVGVDCDLVARATASAAAAEILALRRAPGRLGEAAVGSKVLTHADEQTVVGLAAVLKAIASGGLDPAGFAGWGVVAAPRFLGRSAFDAVFPQFLREGPWGVSPLLISSHSLHSVSGIVSQVLKAQGPNLGVAGTPGGEEQALLAAAVMLADGLTPGVWVVSTGWNPGWNGAGDGESGSPAVCEALALALTAPRAEWTGPRLFIAPGEVRFEPRGKRVDPGHDRRHAPHPTEPLPGIRELKGDGHGG